VLLLKKPKKAEAIVYLLIENVMQMFAELQVIHSCPLHTTPTWVLWETWNSKSMASNAQKWSPVDTPTVMKKMIFLTWKEGYLLLLLLCS